MKVLFGIALGALVTLAGGCMSIGADESAGNGRLMPVGIGAADFARARMLVLDEEMSQLGDVEGVLTEQQDLSLKTWQDWHNRSADAWSDPHFTHQERPRIAWACNGLAQESMDQWGRYRSLPGSYDARVTTMCMVQSQEKRSMEAFNSMTLVAP